MPSVESEAANRSSCAVILLAVSDPKNTMRE
jgi:hypothetical protein